MFANETFDLVISLGVLSWLHSPAVAVKEMARVARAGGEVIVTWLNAADLPYLLDPRRSPMLSGQKNCKEGRPLPRQGGHEP
jgi:SAM-dependent methyltransferase